MLYEVQAHIEASNDSYGIRKLLYENGFGMSLYSRLTLVFYKYEEDYKNDEPSVLLPSNGRDLVFDFVYNSRDDFPPKEVLERLKTDPSVESFKFARYR